MQDTTGSSFSVFIISKYDCENFVGTRPTNQTSVGEVLNVTLLSITSDYVTGIMLEPPALSKPSHFQISAIPS